MGIEIGPGGVPIVTPDKPKESDANNAFTPPSDIPAVITEPPVVEDVKAVITDNPIVTDKVSQEAAQTEKPTLTESIVPTVIDTKSAKQALLDECIAILKSYGGVEGNIPLNHEYWDKMNKFRSL